jgi:hypothetical protein
MLTTNCTSSSCSGEQSEGEVWIYPAMLRVSFAGLDCDVTRVEADVTDWAGSGACNVDLMDSSGGVMATGFNSQVGSMGTINVQSSMPATAVGICGYETQVHEIRLY